MSDPLPDCTASPIPTTGFLDLHSHLLPGIDDGCRSLADSITCVQRLQQAGFVGTVCTPHIWDREFPHNTPANIAHHVAELSDRLQERGLTYHLWPGGEVRIAEGAIVWFEKHGVPTLGPSRCVLVDFWEDCWPKCGDRLLDYLFANGYQPILAHPERSNLAEDAIESLLGDLQKRGVWLQGNLNSIHGGEGVTARRRMQRWLRQQRYHLVATDMHRPGYLEGRVGGIHSVAEEVGTATRDTLLSQRPREVLLG